MALSKLTRLANEVEAEKVASSNSALASIPTLASLADMRFEAQADELARLVLIDAPIATIVAKAIEFEADYLAVPLAILDVFYVRNGYPLAREINKAKTAGRESTPYTLN